MLSPTQAARSLINMGLSQNEIARELSTPAKKVHPSTINRIARGEVDNPSWEIGNALNKLVKNKLEESLK